MSDVGGENGDSDPVARLFGQLFETWNRWTLFQISITTLLSLVFGLTVSSFASYYQRTIVEFYFDIGDTIIGYVNTALSVNIQLKILLLILLIVLLQWLWLNKKLDSTQTKLGMINSRLDELEEDSDQ